MTVSPVANPLRRPARQRRRRFAAFSVVLAAVTGAFAVVAVVAVEPVQPVQAAGIGLPDVADVAMSANTGCAVFTAGSVACWGDGVILGAPARRSHTTPTSVGSFIDATDIAVGGRHACVAYAEGLVSCWGDNQFGRTGTTVGPLSAPTLVPGIVTATSVAVGERHSCALIESGDVWCWGDNTYSQLASSTLSGSVTPVKVPGISDAVAITAGSYHTCVRLATAVARCWGNNEVDQIGIDTVSTVVTTPTSPNDLIAVIDIDAGGAHTCAVVQDGLNEEVRCWGSNDQLQVGVESPAEVPEPTPVAPFITTASRVEAGAYSTCVIHNDGDVSCWGLNAFGMRGDGSVGASNATPSSVVGINQAVEMSAGLGACVIDTAADLSCWGGNFNGSLGVASSNATPSAHWIREEVSLQLPEYSPIAPRRFLDTRDGGTTFDGEGAAIGLVPAGGIVQLRVRGRGGIPGSAPAAALNIAATAGSGPGFVTVYPCDQPRPEASSLNIVGGASVRANLVVAAITTTGPQTNNVCIYAHSSMHLIVDAVGYFTNSPGFTSLTPARLLETRAGLTTVDGLFAGGGLVPGGGVVEVTVAGRGGVPSDARAAILNVTATQSSAAGFVTVWPCGSSKPLASSLNVQPGISVANMVVSRIATAGPSAGKVCLSPNVSMHLVVDVNGVLTADSVVNIGAPYRVVDTRASGVTIDGEEQGEGPVVGGTTRQVTVTNRGSLLFTAGRTVILNVTATGAVTKGYLTVSLCSDAGAATTSTVNYPASASTPIGVMVELGPNDKVCVYAHTTTHIVVDVVGWYAY